MPGSMQDTALSISLLIEFAARNHPDTPIVSSVAGRRHAHDYASTYERVLRLAGALRAAGIGHGDRVGTLAWNDFRHLELYFAVPGIGAITHTINPRLSTAQIEFVVNHAGDRLLFLDPDFLEFVRGVAPLLPSIESFVVLGDAPGTTLQGRPMVGYEEFMNSAVAVAELEILPEATAAGLCYTSGTTGDPKGVLYTHRSTVLHAFAACSADGLAFSSRDVVLPIVPMFHANAWGTPFACAMSGAAMVLPGGRLDAPSLHRLIVDEGVTFAAGVPTIWARLLDHADEQRLDFGRLAVAGIGGSAPTPRLLERLHGYGLDAFHGWGMTETSPLGGTGRLRRGDAERPVDERLRLQLGQGRELFGLERRIVDDAGRALPRDGRTVGRLQARGPWVVDRYFGSEDISHLHDGWFDTGDVATIDRYGRMRLVDRAKDLIKSGGEWISSIELESLASRHPQVAEVAAVAVPDEQWGERPRLVVRLQGGVPEDGAAERVRVELRAILGAQLAGWQVPQRIDFVEAMPYAATGKIDKKRLRRE